jgi:hypothetical protein
MLKDIVSFVFIGAMTLKKVLFLLAIFQLLLGNVFALNISRHLASSSECNVHFLEKIVKRDIDVIPRKIADEKVYKDAFLDGYKQIISKQAGTPEELYNLFTYSKFPHRTKYVIRLPRV